MAILKELASLGTSKTQAAILCDVSVPCICWYCRRFGIKMRNGRDGRPGWLTALILRDYGKPGMTPSVMGERYGTSGRSVSVRVCNLRKAGMLPALKSGKLAELGKAAT